MIKSKKSNLTMVLSVIILLVCLLLSIVNITGAWFTDGSGANKTINTIIKTGEANLNVYQEDNTGTQTLLSKSLPTGYTQLEYIRSTGTQYINTGYVANGNTSIDMEFELTTISGTQTLYCSRLTMNSNTFTAFLLPNQIRLDYASSQIQTTLTVSENTRYSLQTNYNSATLNGTKFTTSASQTTFSATNPMTLFASYTGYSNGSFSGVGNYSLMRIYKFTIYESGKVVKNLIPAKNSAGTIGMYDLVQDKFYTNAGTGTFVAGSEVLAGSGVSLAYDSTNKTNNKIDVVSLPTGYTQVEYLESTGTQYLTIGYYANGNTSIDMEFEMTSVSKTATLYCSRTDLRENTFTVFVTDQNIRSDYNTSQTLTNMKIATNVRYSLQTMAGKVVLNGIEFNTGVGKATFTATAPMSLFASSGTKNTIDNKSLMKIFKFKIYENENLVRQLVPAKNSSGALGMYDLVEDKFYTNAGTGSFVAGEEISGAQNTLKLLLKNEDFGKSFGVRYKVEFFVATPTGKQALTATIAGMTAPTSSTNGFKLNSDGWYYYQNNAGQNVVFEPATSSATTSKYLMTSFAIDFSNMSNLLGGNSIYMQISVESVVVS